MTTIPQPQLGTIEQYRDRFANVIYWQPYVEIICARHDLTPCQNLRCHNPGTCPTFVVDDRWVVKFFGRLFNGQATFSAEFEANQILTANNCTLSPKLIAHGNLLETDMGWPWPYLVFEYLPGVSLGEVFSEISLVDRLNVAQRLGTYTKVLHQIPLDNCQVLCQNWGTYSAMLQNLYPACTQRQREWGMLPAHLCAQMRTYLLPIDEIVDTTMDPVLLHADITGDHVLGGEDAGHWVMHGLIDYGDALVGDPDYELIPLHLDAFRCDKRLLGAYLNAYGSEIADWQAFTRKAMSLSLLHQFNVLAGVFNKLHGAQEVGTLDELADLIWNPNLPGITPEV